MNTRSKESKKSAGGGRKVKTITIRIPAWSMEMIRARAAAQDSTQSRYVRSAINAEFIEHGLEPLFAFALVGFLLLAQIYDYFQ
jgi:hypothetical protein